VSKALKQGVLRKNVLHSSRRFDRAYKKEYNIYVYGQYQGCLCMKYSELKILLKKSGCFKQNEGTRHEQWFSPITNKIFQVGRHDTEDVKKGILNRILKDAGLK
jgi:predicted RNA binding protein YcfA (HicA-like mRNA interferase family)